MPAPKPKRHEWRSIAEYGWPKRGEEVEFLICKNPIALIPACMTDSDLTEGTGKLCSIAGDSPEGRKQYYVQRLVSCDKYGLYCSGKRYAPTLLFLTAEDAQDYLDAIAADRGWTKA